MALSTTKALGPSVIQPMVAAHRQQIRSNIAEIQADINQAKQKSVQIAALATRPISASIGEQCGRTLDIMG